MNVLVIEDDEKLGAQICEHLRGMKLTPTWIKDGDEAREAELGIYALVMLDLMLPGTYGLDLLKLFRKRSDVPILILSARDDTADKVRGLKLGADDYVTKPFWPEELTARVSARLRRPTMHREENSIVVGALEIAPGARTLKVSGQPVELTKVEFEILLHLARRSGSAVSRAALVDSALDPDRAGTERTLDVHVSRLRKKLGDASGQVATVWGIGYRLERGGDE